MTDYAKTREGKLEVLNDHLKDVQIDRNVPGLTPAMEQRYFRVQSVRQWADVEAKFKTEAIVYGVVSYDTESYVESSKTNLMDQLEGILLGTFEAVYDIDIAPFIAAARRHSVVKVNDMNTILPQTIIDVLGHKEVIKVGSNIGADAATDLRDFNLRIKPVYDTQFLH